MKTVTEKLNSYTSEQYISINNAAANTICTLKSKKAQNNVNRHYS